MSFWDGNPNSRREEWGTNRTRVTSYHPLTVVTSTWELWRPAMLISEASTFSCSEGSVEVSVLTRQLRYGLGQVVLAAPPRGNLTQPVYFQQPMSILFSHAGFSPISHLIHSKALHCFCSCLRYLHLGAFIFYIAQVSPINIDAKYYWFSYALLRLSEGKINRVPWVAVSRIVAAYALVPAIQLVQYTLEILRTDRNQELHQRFGSSRGHAAHRMPEPMEQV